MIELSVVIPIHERGAHSWSCIARSPPASTPWGRPYEDHHRGRWQHGRQLRDAGAHCRRRRTAAHDPVPPQLRPDRCVLRRLRPCRGRFIVTSDGDLQNDPQRHPGDGRAGSSRGLDIVCGWRKDRKDAFISRRLPSMVANRLISWATGVQLHDYGCSLKVFRAEVVKPLKLYGEMHRFIPAIASEQGVAHRGGGGQPSARASTARRSTASPGPSA